MPCVIKFEGADVFWHFDSMDAEGSAMSRIAFIQKVCSISGTPVEKDIRASNLEIFEKFLEHCELLGGAVDDLVFTENIHYDVVNEALLDEWNDVEV